MPAPGGDGGCRDERLTTREAADRLPDLPEEASGSVRR